MADLRIVDAPEIPTENITGEEKLPTGGSGNYSITLDSVADYTKTKKDLVDNTSVDGKVNGVRQELDTHIENLLNPHQVTKGQIGLGNVDNTADADKPVSNSTQAAIISAVAPKSDKTYVDNQLTLKANKSDVYTKQESSDLVNNSISTALIPVNTSLDLVKRGVVNRYDSSLTYNSGERVVLTNGDIVKSTVDGNTNDPNVNMTGWKNPLSTENILYKNGYSVESALYYLTPEMFGAKGDYLLPDGTINPNPTDDYQAIQSMLDAGAIGCTFEFDGAKTYYNAMANNGVAVSNINDRNIWIRNKKATFKFNGAELLVRTPKAIANGTYSDTGGAVLLIDQVDGVTIYDANINGNSPLGIVKWIDMSDWYGIPPDTYCVGNTGFEGLWLRECSNIKMINSYIQRCGFNLFLDRCTDFNIQGLRTEYAMQSIQGIIDSGYTDAALGAGLKVYRCRDGYVEVNGKYNVNATAEIEHNNINVRVVGSGRNDMANSLITYASQDIELDFNIFDSLGEGFVLWCKSAGFALTSRNITGRVNITNARNTGMTVKCDNLIEDVHGIDLNITTINCKEGGLKIINSNTTHMPRNLKINHTSINDGDRSKYNRLFSGHMTGIISGSSRRDTAPPENIFGFKVEGENTADTCLGFNLDLTDSKIYPYQVLDSAYAELLGVKLGWATQFSTVKTLEIKSVKYGLRESNENAISFGSAYFKPMLSTAPNNIENNLYIDAMSKTASGSGFTYAVRLFSTT